MRLGRGPSAGRDSPVTTASKRNRENPAPPPTGSKDRREDIWPGGGYKKVDARSGRGFVFGYPNLGFHTFMTGPLGKLEMLLWFADSVWIARCAIFVRSGAGESV